MKRSTFLKALGLIAITPKIVSSIGVEPKPKIDLKKYTP